MIENIGYTHDGMVFMSLKIEHEGQHGTFVMTMTPQMAKNASEVLNQAAQEAEEKYGVRNSSNTH